jgi:hypothetical protein
MFTSLEALDSTRHKALRLGTTDYAFARDLTTVPLSLSEVVPASRSYPIVFAPQALLSLRTGGNLFVTEDGRWPDGAYVPAHVRRYPFILGQQPETLQGILTFLTRFRDEAATVEANANEAVLQGPPHSIPRRWRGWSPLLTAP